MEDHGPHAPSPGRSAAAVLVTLLAGASLLGGVESVHRLRGWMFGFHGRDVGLWVLVVLAGAAAACRGVHRWPAPTVFGLARLTTTGTLDTSKVQGMGPGKRENWGMLVAYVESPSGPYFARLLGPGPTVSRWEASFRQWIASFKPTSG